MLHLKRSYPFLLFGAVVLALTLGWDRRVNTATAAEMLAKCQHNFLHVDDTAGYCAQTLDATVNQGTLFFPLTAFLQYDGSGAEAVRGYIHAAKHTHAVGGSGYHKAGHDATGLPGGACTDCGLSLVCDQMDGACEFTSPALLLPNFDATGAWSIKLFHRNWNTGASGSTDGTINIDVHCRNVALGVNNTDYYTGAAQQTSNVLTLHTFTLNSAAAITTLPAVCLVDVTLDPGAFDAELLGVWIGYTRKY